MYALIRDNEFRVAGAFSVDKQFLWFIILHFF
jgi:hypothetical protein